MCHEVYIQYYRLNGDHGAQNMMRLDYSKITSKLLTTQIHIHNFDKQTSMASHHTTYALSRDIFFSSKLLI